MWACAHWCVSPNARYYTTVPVTNIRREVGKGKLEGGAWDIDLGDVTRDPGELQSISWSFRP